MQKHSSMDNRLDVPLAIGFLTACSDGGTPYAQQDADGDGVKNSSDAFPLTPANLVTLILMASGTIAITA